MNGAVVFLSAEASVLDAFLYAIVGFLIVLAVLALLVGIFYLTGLIFKTKAMSKDKLFERRKKPAAKQVESGDDEKETVAAITAAVALCLSDAESSEVKPDFVIRRIVRKK